MQNLNGIYPLLPGSSKAALFAAVRSCNLTRFVLNDSFG